MADTPNTPNPLDAVVTELRALRLELAELRKVVTLASTTVAVINEGLNVPADDPQGVSAVMGRLALRADRAFQ